MGRMNFKFDVSKNKRSFKCIVEVCASKMFYVMKATYLKDVMSSQDAGETLVLFS